MMIVAVAISNPHGLPSAATNWSLAIEFPLQTVAGEIPPSEAKDVVIPFVGRKESMTLTPDNFLLRTTAQPIPAGGTAAGWLTAVFRGISLEEINKQQPVVILSCADVITEKRHTFRLPLTRSHQGIKLPGD